MDVCTSAILLYHLIIAVSNLECSEESSEDVDLYGLLSGGLGLFYALPEVSEQLQTVLWSNSWKGPTKENYSTVYDSHSKRKGTWKFCALSGRE